MSVLTSVVRLFYPYESRRRVWRGPARGLDFIVQPGIGFTYAIGTDLAAPRFFRRHLHPGMTVFDVGANKGQMTLIFAALVAASGRVIAFEPVPVEYASLERNVRLNGLAHVRLLNVAASDNKGQMAFSYAAERPTQGKLVNVEPTYDVAHAQTFPVQAIRLDDVPNERPPDVIKIDVEGAAAAVLRGSARILDEAGPSVYLELHGPEEQAGVRDELLSRGYVARSLSGDVIADPVARWCSPLWCTKK